MERRILIGTLITLTGLRPLMLRIEFFSSNPRCVVQESFSACLAQKFANLVGSTERQSLTKDTANFGEIYLNEA